MLRVQGSGFKVQRLGVGLKVPGLQCRVYGVYPRICALQSSAYISLSFRVRQSAPAS
jgi:hypothetical protein